MRTVARFTRWLDRPVVLEQNSNTKFRVKYGRQVVKDQLTREQAAKELGECIMHSLSCNGRVE